MIVFDLRCSGGHVFEGWFGSSADFEGQRSRGLLTCPLCGAGEIAKAVMAPRLAARDESPTSPSEEMKAMMAKLAAMQKKILENSHYVGERFADEARAIHLGEVDARSIHGMATKSETDGLLVEGIPVAPLPFPVIEPGEEN